MVVEKVEVQYSVNDNGATKKVGLLSGAFEKLKNNAKLVAVAGIGLLTATITKGLGAFKKQELILKNTEAVLKSTKNAAGLTAKEIQNMARGFQKVTSLGDEVIQSGQNMLLTFTNIGKEVFPDATETMLNMATAMNGGVTPSAEMLKGTAIQLGKALNDPTAGAAALRRVGVALTEQQMEQIKAFQASGDVMSAQKIILKELGTEFGGLARAQAQTLDGALAGLTNAWGDLSEEIGKVFAPMVQTIAIGLKVLVERFNGMSDGSKKMIVVFGSIGVAILSLLPLMAVMATSMAAISWPVLLAVGAAGLLVAAFVKFKVVRDIVSGIGKAIYYAFVFPIQKTIEVIKKLIDWFKSLKKSKDKSNESSDKKEKKAKNEEEKDLEKRTGGNTDAIAAEEDAKTQLILQKDAERNQALLDQQAAQREEKKALEDELAAVKDEEELAAFEEKLVKMQEQGQIITDLEAAAENKRAEIKRANWQKDFSTWMGFEKIKLVQKQTTAQQMATWDSFMANSANSKNKEVAAIGKAMAKKDIATKTAQAAMSAFSAMAGIPYVGPVLGMIAAAAAIAFGAEQMQAVDTPLAEGGSMIVDQPTRIGNNVLAGEAGPERIDVTPLSGGGGEQTINNIIQIDGETIATNVLKTGQRMRSEGTVDDGL